MMMWIVHSLSDGQCSNADYRPKEALISSFSVILAYASDQCFNELDTVFHRYDELIRVSLNMKFCVLYIENW